MHATRKPKAGPPRPSERLAANSWGPNCRKLTLRVIQEKGTDHGAFMQSLSPWEPRGARNASLHVHSWPNGDVSFVSAANKDDAIFLLDEEDSASEIHAYKSSRFMIHCRLTDEGKVQLQGFVEKTLRHVDEIAYPVLNKTESELLSANSTDQWSDEEKSKLADAARTEKTRLMPANAV